MSRRLASEEGLNAVIRHMIERHEVLPDEKPLAMMALLVRWTSPCKALGKFPWPEAPFRTKLAPRSPKLSSGNSLGPVQLCQVGWVSLGHFGNFREFLSRVRILPVFLGPGFLIRVI